MKEFLKKLRKPTSLQCVPLCLALLFPLTFAICYTMAYSVGHIDTLVAFISDAGTQPPEQYVFAQLVNTGAVLFGLFAYIRFKQVKYFMQIRFGHDDHRHIKHNLMALCFAFTSCLGMSILGNFPKLHMREIHNFGVFLAFVCGSIYAIFQGYITLKMLPFFQTKFIANLRILFGAMGLIQMLYVSVHVTTLIILRRNSGEKWNDPKKPLQTGKYPFRAIAVIVEWMLVTYFDAFIITFVPEFGRFKWEDSGVRFLIDIDPVGEGGAVSKPEVEKQEVDEEKDESSESESFVSSLTLVNS